MLIHFYSFQNLWKVLQPQKSTKAFVSDHKLRKEEGGQGVMPAYRPIGNCQSWKKIERGYTPFILFFPPFCISPQYLKVDLRESQLRALSTLRGLRGAPEVPPLCRETQSLGQQMLERWEQMG